MTVDSETLDHLTVALQQCVIASNRHFEAERFAEAKEWHDLAVQAQAELDAYIAAKA